MLSAVCLLIVASCKKTPSTPENERQTTCQLTEVTWSNDPAKTLYVYDDNGKVSSSKFDDNAYNESYTYSTNQIVRVVKDWNNPTGWTYKYDLDAKGRIIKETYNTNGQTNFNITEYTYNSDGYMTEKKVVNGAKTTFNYTDGNLTTYNDGSGAVTITYGTDVAQINFYHDYVPRGLPDFYETPLQSYYGKLSKNLPSKVTYSNGDYVNFTYEKDHIGNITRVNVTSKNGYSFYSTYSYTCKNK